MKLLWEVINRTKTRNKSFSTQRQNFDHSWASFPFKRQPKIWNLQLKTRDFEIKSKLNCIPFLYHSSSCIIVSLKVLPNYRSYRAEISFSKIKKKFLILFTCLVSYKDLTQESLNYRHHRANYWLTNNIIPKIKTLERNPRSADKNRWNPITQFKKFKNKADDQALAAPLIKDW